MGKKIMMVSSLVFLFSGSLTQAEKAQTSAPADSGIARKDSTPATDPTESGPQASRDLSKRSGSNKRIFAYAPDRHLMNLCNIHLHENAEHRGGDFTIYAGNGHGRGNNTGYKYNGTLSAAELASVGRAIGESDDGNLVPGDTVEIHFVYTSANARPGGNAWSLLY